ncbi:hypothetical protein MMC15_007973 [Xylographa vitiligo]|nr:hypothetical protein [Xylographa vitiligo]
MGIDITVFKGSFTGKIVKGSSHKEDVATDHVLVKVTHSGVCGTDCHYTRADMVLGHEGVGIVQAVGPEVSVLKVGDRVGWGYNHSGCGHCLQCRTGWIGNCAEAHQFGKTELDQGSFGSHAIWKEEVLFHIPEGIASADAAPLMCAGITVFAPLILNNVKPLDCVGVIGIGGLGHLAIQMAAKMGCEVVAFSGTKAKRDEAMMLGATHFYATKGVKELKVHRQIDHLLVTTSNHPDWEMYLKIMAHHGSIYPLTISTEPLSIPYLPFLLNNISFVGTTGGPLYLYGQMLDFVAFHKIKPIIQEFPMTVDGITDALNKLDTGEMRYRGVLLAD